MENKGEQKKQEIIQMLKECDGYCLVGFVYNSNKKDMAMTTHINQASTNPYVAKICLPTMKAQFKDIVKELENAKLQTTPSNG